MFDNIVKLAMFLFLLSPNTINAGIVSNFEFPDPGSDNGGSLAVIDLAVYHFVCKKFVWDSSAGIETYNISNQKMVTEMSNPWHSGLVVPYKGPLLIHRQKNDWINTALLNRVSTRSL